MKTQKKDGFYGIALNQIVEHHAFKALNRASEKQWHYVIHPQLNKQVRILVKYAGRKTGDQWKFTFQDDDLILFAEDNKKGPAFVLLVCWGKSVCMLSSDELFKLVNLLENKSQQIGVYWEAGQSMRVVWVGKSKLSHTIPHSRFPDNLFDR